MGLHGCGTWLQLKKKNANIVESKVFILFKALSIAQAQGDAQRTTEQHLWFLDQPEPTETGTLPLWWAG